MILRTTLFRRFSVAVLCAAGFAVAISATASGLAGGVRLELLPQQWQDDSGKPITLTGLAGERVVLTMAYANCHRICPMTIDSLKRLQKAMDERGERAQFVIVGYDPDNEDAATWRQYRLSHHLARTNWHFLTGTPADTAQLAHQLHFELWKYDEHVMHDSRVLLFDVDGVLAHELTPESGDWRAAL